MTNLNVRIGETIKIQLELNHPADYVWYYEVSEDWIISMTEPYGYPAKSASLDTGTPVDTKIFDVKGLKAGSIDIRFYLIRPWEQHAVPLEERFFRVKVN